MERIQVKRPWVAGLFFAVILIAYVGLAIALTQGPDFNDETEKLLTAMLLAEGRTLYRDIFVQHGPVAYMLSHLLYLLIPVQDIGVQRALPILLSLGTIAAVMFSPLVRSWPARFVAGSVLAAGLASVQAIFGLVMAMYQVYAGLLLVAGMALFVAPFALAIPVRRWHAVIGGACLTLVYLCAFSFGVSLAFCALACLSRLLADADSRSVAWARLGEAAAGALGAGAIVAAWMLAFGDFKGYLIDHIYFNLTAYKAYLAGFDLWKTFDLLIPAKTYFLTPDPVDAIRAGVPYRRETWFTHFIFALPVSIFVASLPWMAARRMRLRPMLRGIGAGAILLMAVIWANPRVSLNFGAATYVITALGMTALATAAVFDRHTSTSPVGAANLIFLAVLAAAAVVAQFSSRTYLYAQSPIGYYSLRGTIRPEASPTMDLLHSVLGSDRHAQQVPFDLTFYVRAGVTPSFGIFYWMPWMKDYAEHPVKGYELDLCGQVERAPPKAFSYVESEASVWGHSPDSFLGCFKDLLKRKYLRLLGLGSVWLRADLVADRADLLRTAIIPQTLDLAWLSQRQRKTLGDIQRSSTPLQLANACSAGETNPLPAPAPVSACDETLVMRDDRVLGSATGQCVEIEGASSADGAPARYWPCSGAANQAFEQVPGQSGFKLRNKFSSKCLKAMDGRLIQTSCDQGDVWAASSTGSRSAPSSKE